MLCIILAGVFSWLYRTWIVRSARRAPRIYRDSHRGWAGFCCLAVTVLFAGGDRSALGLLLGGIALGVCLGWRTLSCQRIERAMEGQVLFELSVVCGLLRVGLALPQAIAEATARSPRVSKAREFAVWAQRSLSRVTEGDSVTEGLSYLKSRFPVAGLGTLLEVMALCYRRGLPVLPILEMGVRRLSHRARLYRRIHAVVEACILQAGIGALVPWAVYLLATHLIEIPATHVVRSPWAVIVLALAWQGIGLALVFRMTKYE